MSDGKSLRTETPRSAQAVWEPPTDRKDPVELLEQQAQNRVPELVPIRYGRMLASPFAFFRGAALVMANDLAGTPTTGIRVQLCGDAHLANFGLFASPERRLVFDLNDFDETLPGPWEWDVKRLAASFAIAGRHREFPAKERKVIIGAAANEYRNAIRRFTEMGDLEIWYERLDTDSALQRLEPVVEAEQAKRAKKIVDKARTRDSLSAFNKLATVVDGKPRIAADPPLIVPIEDLTVGMDHDQLVAHFERMLAGYRETLVSDRQVLFDRYRFAHLAHKVVGVGSVGTRSWIILMVGRAHGEPLLLQAKEAGPSVLEAFAGQSEFSTSGERVVAGQRLMQATSDIFLGWQRVSGIDGNDRDYYVRQLKDWKGSADLDRMLPKGMEAYARMCGWTLARAHARSGDRAAIAAYLGSGDNFDRAICAFAETYADQNERDFDLLRAAAKEGRITAESGL